MKSDGWIEHDGKGPPDLDPETEVYVRFQDGSEEENGYPDSVGFWCPDSWDKRDFWVKSDDHDYIIAYKVVSNEE